MVVLARLLVAAALLAIGLPTAGVSVPEAGAATLPAGFVEETVFSGLDNPTAMRFSPDGRVFVAEKSGIIKVFDSLADPTPTVFADLRTNVHNFWDRGLLGLELHPNFPATPYVYVLYAFDAAIGGTAPRWGSPGVSSDPCPTPPGPTTDGCVIGGRVSRLTASGNTMTAEQVLVEDWCQQFPSHSGGGLAFGPDGMLYAAGGDGASFDFVDYGQEGSPVNPCGDPGGAAPTPPTAEGGALRAQDVRTSSDPVGLNGTIIRIDPLTGAGLANNPMGSSPDANERRIVATGFRNPFRIAVQPGTNAVWVGDVGWNDWEEIDAVTNPIDGAIDNFGWPCYEGAAKQGGYDATDLSICEGLYAQPGAVTNPVYKYQHNQQVVADGQCPTGSSSIGGLAFAPVSGGSYPASYAGALFFADASRGCIWVMKAGSNGVPSPTLIETFVAGAALPVDLRVGPDGMLYYVDHDGTIRRIRYAADVTAPTVISVTPGAGATGVALDANAEVSFSEPMNASTVNTSTVTLRTGDANGPVVPAAVGYDATTRRATLDPTSPLVAETTFTVVVEGGASGVTDVAGNPLAADVSVSFTTTAPPTSMYLSELPFVGTPTNGWGPIERDRSNGEEGPADGTTLTVGSETFAKGLGAHASSEARFAVSSGCTRFQARVGVDEEVGELGTVTFQVFGDTTELGSTVTRDGTQPSALVDVDIAGLDEIRLVVGPGADNIDYDHADWGDAKFLCAPTDSTAPTVTAVVPGAGATGVALDANVVVSFSEPMNASSVTTSSVTLRTGTASGPVVPTVVTYDTATQTATIDPVPVLTAGTAFSVVVMGGASGVKDVAGNPLAADVSVSFTTTAESTSVQYLSDLPFVGTPTNGWGPIERDRSNGEDGPADGTTLTVGTETFAKGLGAHASSEARFAVPSGCTRFQARVGVDEEVGDLGTVTFQVFGDTTELGSTVTRDGTQSSAAIDVDVTGRSEIRLVVGPGVDNIDYDHADWGDAKYLCATPVTPHAPQPVIVTPVPTAWKVGQVISFSGTATDVEDGPLAPSALSWSLRMHHCPSSCHVHIVQDYAGVASGSFAAPDHEYPSYLELQLTATDSSGLKTTVSRQLDPLTVALTVASSPTGLALVVDAATVTAPATRTVIAGSSHTVTAATPQSLGGTSYTFVRWSDGGARSHQVVMGTAPKTLTATFKDATSPKVSSVTPARSSSGSSRAVSPALRFSEAMNRSTIKTTTVKFRRGSATGAVGPARVVYNAATRTVTVDPVVTLAARTTYTVVVTGGSSGVKDLAGNGLASTYSWSFRTR